jgi:hypothetical protein
MSELERIKAQIDNGQGLTCAQACILWDALSEASRYANQALRNYQPTPDYTARLQNAYAALSGNSLAQWQPSAELLSQLWPGGRE